MIKRIIGIIGAISIILTTGFMAYSPSSIFNAHIYFSAQLLKEKEEELGIKTKDDTEVFEIKGDEETVILEYADEMSSLSFKVPSLEKLFGSEMVLEKTKKGFTVHAKIEDEKDIESLRLSIAIPEAWTIDYAKNHMGDENGSLGIYNEIRMPVASTGLATAIDSMGKELTANLEVKDNSIIVSLKGDNVSYPVDVSYGVYAVNVSRGVTDYFHYAGFNLVYNGSLTLGPRYFDEGSTIECTNAWNAVYNLFYPYSPYWTTSTQTQSMNDQYWCHANFAKTKPQWNLEPTRPVVSWATMILSACNPE